MTTDERREHEESEGASASERVGETEGAEAVAGTEIAEDDEVELADLDPNAEKQARRVERQLRRLQREMRG